MHITPWVAKFRSSFPLLLSVIMFIAALSIALRPQSGVTPLAEAQSAGTPSTNLYILAEDGLYRYDAITGALKNTPTTWSPHDPRPPAGTAFANANIYGNSIPHLVLDHDRILVGSGSYSPTVYDLLTMQELPADPLRLDFDGAIAAIEPGSSFDFLQSLTLEPGGFLYAVFTLLNPSDNLQHSYLARFDPTSGAFLGTLIAESYPLDHSRFPLTSAFRGHDGELYTTFYEGTSYQYGIRLYRPAQGTLVTSFLQGAVRQPVRADRSGQIYTINDGGPYYYTVERYNLRSGVREGIAAISVEPCPSSFSPPPPYEIPTGDCRPYPLSFDIGDDGSVYVLEEALASWVGNQFTLKRFDGRTGSLFSTLITADQMPHGRIIGIAVDGTGGNDVSPARPANVHSGLRVAPGIQAAPGSIITLTLTATNAGHGSARDATLTLPLDPNLVTVLDARFSRADAWVSDLRADQVTIRTGNLGYDGDTVTGTLRLRLRDDAPHAAEVRFQAELTWSDSVKGGEGRGNRVTLHVGPEQDGLQPLEIHPVAGGIQVSSGDFAPNEPVALWYDAPDGRSTAMGRVTADAEGAISVLFPSADRPAGRYQIVAQGIWSEAVATAVVSLPAP